MVALHRYWVILLWICLFGTSASAQLSVQVRGGYNLPAAQSIIEMKNTVDTNFYATQEPIFTTLGGGGTFGLDLGYGFDEHFSVQLGFQYLHGSKTVALVSENPLNQITALAYTRQGQATLGGKVSTGNAPLSIYGAAGLVIPVFGVTTLDLDFVSESFNADQFTRTENEGRFSVGFYGGLGVEYTWGDRWGIALESRFTNLRIIVAKATVVEKFDRVNQEDLLPDTPVSNIITEYRDALDESSNNPDFNSDFVNSEPLEELGYTSNYSNVSFQLGWTYYLGR